MYPSLDLKYIDSTGTSLPVIAAGGAPVWLHGIILTDASGLAQVDVLAADGSDPVISLAIPAASTTVSVMFPGPIPFHAGLYVNVSGTAPLATFLIS